MARAWTVAWVGMAVGSVLAPVAVEAQMPAQPEAVSPADTTLSRPARVRLAFRTGMECYRKGDYERAASCLQQAQAGRDNLTADEKQSLSQWVFLNDTALRARRDGADQLRQVEQAIQQGRTQEALAGIKTVTPNQQFLSAADKQRLQQLNDQLTPVRAVPSVYGKGTSTVSVAQVRSKLAQARLMMSRGNFDAAQALALEAAQLNVAYEEGEDTPHKVLDDLATARKIAATPNNTKSLMMAARSALAQGRLDEAEKLAQLADQSRTVMDKMTFWSDTPAKILKDVQSAKARQLALQNSQRTNDRMAPATTVSAKPFGNGPGMLTSTGGESPDPSRRAKVDMYGNPIGNLPETIASDPRAMLKQARELYNSGKLEEADRLAQHVASAKGVRWGLFEDSPDKLFSDLRKARAKRDQEESVRLLAEAHKLFDQGNLAEAERLARAAERKHGPYPYPLFEFDRPSKLLAEIEAAKAKNPPQGMSDMPPAGNNKNNSREQSLATKPGQPGAVVPATVERTTDVSQVSHTTTASPYVPAGPNAAVDGKSSASPYVAAGSNAVADANNANGPSPYAPAGPKALGESKKTQAQLLLAQAHQLEKEGRLLEAREKVVEAQKLGVVFGVHEETPEQCVLTLGAACQRQIEHYLLQAGEFMATAEVDPSRYQRAEMELTQARRLAAAFRFDTMGIDSKLAWVQQTRDKSFSLSAAGKTGAFAQANHQETRPFVQESPLGQHGRELLNQARMELRAGQTVSARKLAEAAFDPKYGMQDEAQMVLRSIDTEEFNQKILAATRAYDAGMAAFGRRDFALAGTMLRTLNYHYLTPDKQARLKEVMLVPEMQPPTAVAQTTHQEPAGNMLPPTRMAQATDLEPTRGSSQEADFAKQVLAMQEVNFQKWRQTGLDAQKDAMKLFQAGDTDRALDVLKDYKESLGKSGLDSDRIALLRRQIDGRLQQLSMVKHQRDFEKKQVDERDGAAKFAQRKVEAERAKKEQIDKLMKQYDQLYREGKYDQALVCVTKAKDLDPDNAIAEGAITATRYMINVAKARSLKKEKEDITLDGLNDTDHEGPYVDPTKHPVDFDAEISRANRARKALDPLNVNKFKSEKEQAILHRLDQPIMSTMDFKDTPLRQILDDIVGVTGINIVIDEPAMLEENINLNQQVTMRLDGIALKSALNLVLHQAHLTYVVDNEVLNITTENHSRGKLVVRVHPVMDLIMPIPNSDGSMVSNALRAAMNNNSDAATLRLGGTSPLESRNGLGGGRDVSNMTLGGSPAVSPGSFATPAVTKENPRGTMEEMLMKLITNTIAPQTWNTMSGHGSVEFYPFGGALIINQTPDIQEQVAQLLEALRRLQDQEVAVEVRFITVAENFFERIGVDFNINIRTDNSKYEPQIVSQQFRPFGFINHFTPNRFLSGLTPAGNLTQDLNIPVKASSFNMAVPPFGDYPNIPGGNGGLSLGLAFLSDIEVYMFMEAAQGDQRTNVMEAPKITMFNGQTSTITVTDMQFFATAVNVVQAGGQIVFVPTNSLFPTGGVTLTLTATISADRRFVRLSMAPALNSLSSANVPLFPITTFITPVFEGGAVGQPVPFTQFIQQPAFNTITVLTTVNVPDGGTVLMGGLKRLNEGRNEFGPPILSKIPYINRLFKNVGYGREAESLMMMVTPRIIINEEEEQRQVPGINTVLGGGPPGQ